MVDFTKKQLPLSQLFLVVAKPLFITLLLLTDSGHFLSYFLVKVYFNEILMSTLVKKRSNLNLINQLWIALILQNRFINLKISVNWISYIKQIHHCKIICIVNDDLNFKSFLHEFFKKPHWFVTFSKTFWDAFFQKCQSSIKYYLWYT